MGNGEIKNKRVFLEQYRGRKVLITGHTGFKGSWMCRTLLQAGAQVYGYALEAPEDPALFRILSLEKEMASVIGDVRDYEKLFQFMKECRPEIVIHMAAQPIVRESYKRPAYTYETNVMGTVNVLECIRNLESVQSFVNVTTDKVYLNREWDWGYRENEELNGFDPYSNSKSCSELVTASYRQSFFEDRDIAITTMRAGNVIGGGDFAVDRIIPDCVRAAEKEQDYSVAVKKLKKARVYIEDQEMFERYASMQNIIDKLESTNQYFFTVHNQKQEVERYAYFWMNKEKRIILFVNEDMTKEMETDPLTGVPNRKGFYRLATKVLEENANRKYAVLFFNIRRFKAINDLFGYETGDRVIRESVINMQNSSLKPAVLARTEADHFAALVDVENLDLSKLPGILHTTLVRGNIKTDIYGRCGIQYLGFSSWCE